MKGMKVSMMASNTMKSRVRIDAVLNSRMLFDNRFSMEFSFLPVKSVEIRRLSLSDNH